MTSPYHVSPDSVGNLPEGCDNQKYLAPHQSKHWRINIWLETKQCLDDGRYSWNGKESVPLPSINTHIAPMDLKTMPTRPLVQQQQHQQQQQQQQQPKRESSPDAAVAVSAEQPSSSAAAASATSTAPPSSVPRPVVAVAVAQKRQLRVSVFRGDCLDAARDLFVKDGGASSPPLVMDAASARHFGGGYRNGSRAQEEEMCRRSSLALQVDTHWKLQKNSYYPIGAGKGIYTPGCTVFRGSCFQNYAFLPRPFEVAFGIVAAPNKPQLAPDGKSMAGNVAADLLSTLRCFFRMGVLGNHRWIVPVALGTGAFRCPAEHVSKLMMEAIASECQDTCVEEVRIAVFDDHNAVREGNEEGNFYPFARTALGFFGPEMVSIYSENGDDMSSKIQRK